MQSAILSLALWAAAAASPAVAGAAAPVRILALSDLHFDHDAVKAGYGQDTGTVLWASTRVKLKALIAAEHPRFVLLLGDLVGHGVSTSDRQIDLRTIFQDLRHDAGPDLPVFYLPGNNDSLAGNYHAFADKHGQTPLSVDPEGAWPALNSVACGSAKSAAAQACLLDGGDHIKGGYYAAYPLGSGTKLRLVALDSVVFSRNFAAGDGKTQAEAAAEQLTWFERELTEAEGHGEAVIVAMHVPPGKDSYAGTQMWGDVFPAGKPSALATFVASLRRHARVVTLMLSAHTHMDELRLVADTKGRLAVLGLSIPSVSPVHGNNAALKVLTLDPATYAPVEAKTYYSAPEAPAWGDEAYSFTADYGCAPGQTLFACLAGKPRRDVETAMNASYSVRKVGYKAAWPKVDGAIDVTP